MAEAQRKKKGPGDFGAGGRREGAWMAGADSAKEEEAHLAGNLKPRRSQGDLRVGVGEPRGDLPGLTSTGCWQQLSTHPNACSKGGAAERRSGNGKSLLKPQ